MIITLLPGLSLNGNVIISMGCYVSISQGYKTRMLGCEHKNPIRTKQFFYTEKQRIYIGNIHYRRLSRQPRKKKLAPPTVSTAFFASSTIKELQLPVTLFSQISRIIAVSMAASRIKWAEAVLLPGGELLLGETDWMHRPFGHPKKRH